MRAKILHFMSLTGFDQMFERSIEQLTGQFRSNFEPAFGETLPAEPSEALAIVDKALRDRRSTITDAVAAIYERNLTEEDVDALIVFHESPVGRRVAGMGIDVANALNEAADAWQREALKSVEGDLERLFGIGAPDPAPGIGAAGAEQKLTALPDLP